MPNLNGGTVYMPLAEAVGEILDADLLLFRSSGLISRAIRVAGRGIHSHAAKASWHHDRLMCLEVREFVGGRAVTLESQVQKFPGRIDVFRANAGDRWLWNREGSDDYMASLAGVEYGWGAIAKSALMHLPGIRFLVAPPTADEVLDAKRRPYCSAACAMADDFGGGVDVVPHLANWAVSPADLARSLFYQYLFTLE